jgi:sulfite reductase (ferredoxin)
LFRPDAKCREYRAIPGMLPTGVKSIRATVNIVQTNRPAMTGNAAFVRDGRPHADPAALRARLPEFAEAARKFHSGEMNKKEFKSFSGWFGSLPQRDDETHMVRFRLAGGRLTEPKLAYIVDSVEKYGIDLVHLTTGQTIQFHNVQWEDACEILDGMFDVGIIPMGGGGDNPRNVAASPLSGVDPGEAFDVLPFAEASEDYLLGILESIKLPRKFKMAFSNGSGSDVHATIRDLGFVAKPNGKFDVYAGGGLGNRGPRAGVLVLSDCEPSDVLYCVEAMITLFLEHGAYETRAETRTRFMRDRLGEERFVEAFGEHLRASRERGGLDLDIDVILAKPSKTEGWPMSQKQPGMYAARVSPVCGDPTKEELKKFLRILRENPGSEIRTSPNQEMFFINLPREAAENLSKEYSETEFRRSVSCVGSHICQTGLRNSRAALKSILSAEKEQNFPDGTLPRVRISGCGSSCSAHQVGELGLRGATAKTPEGNKPGFEIFYKGSDEPLDVVIGEPLGVIPEESLPAFFIDLGKAVSPGRFSDWIKENDGKFREIVGKYV